MEKYTHGSHLYGKNNLHPKLQQSPSFNFFLKSNYELFFLYCPLYDYYYYHHHYCYYYYYYYFYPVNYGRRPG